MDGSRSPSRYSRADEPTLYLSSSREGITAAMIAHTDASTPELEVIELRVNADRIVDLRDPDALARLGVSLENATAPWQGVGAPPSWRVRDRLVARGANGLIDPGRKAPGLWHLVLLRWNADGTPSVARI
ncbi:MAG: RES family NAD+ phosphorylase [Microbacterium sp.]